MLLVSGGLPVLSHDDLSVLIEAEAVFVSLFIAFLTFLSLSNRRKITAAATKADTAATAATNVASDVAAVKEQVVNGHKKPDGEPINLREENDERHADSTEMQRRILNAIGQIRKDFNRQLGSVRDDIGGIRVELRGIRETVTTDAGRILELERTMPASEVHALARTATKRKAPKK